MPPSAQAETEDAQHAAPTLGLAVHIEHASHDAEIDKAWSSFAERRVGAVAVAADALFNSRRSQIIAMASRYKLPAVYFIRDFADAGGLMSYGGSPGDAYRLAGIYAGRILKGEKPAELPVQQSTRVELVVNLRAARMQGFEMPATILARADEVIE